MSPASATPKKAVKKARSASKEPTSSVMVKKAIMELGDRKGSSLAAIKKYIAAHYKVDMARRAPFICKAIKSAVEKGVLIQTKGKGAAGTFKLATKKSETKVTKKPKSPKKKTTEKKSTKAKTPVKKATKKKTVKPKSPKKTTKSKPKSPKKAASAKKPAKKTSVKKSTKKTPSKKA